MRTDTLVYGFSAQDAHGRRVDPTFSYPMYRQLVADNRTMSDLFAFAPFGDVNLVVNGQADIASAFLASGNYYRALGVTARSGRTIVPDDDTPTRRARRPDQPECWRRGSAAARTLSARSCASTTRRSRSSACCRRNSRASRRQWAKRRISRCPSRSSRSSRSAVNPAEVAPRRAELLVGSGHGPAEAGRHRRAGTRESRRASSSTHRARSSTRSSRRCHRRNERSFRRRTARDSGAARGLGQPWHGRREHEDSGR